MRQQLTKMQAAQDAPKGTVFVAKADMRLIRAYLHPDILQEPALPSGSLNEAKERSASRDQSDADLGLAEQGALPAGEAHVAGQHELVPNAARAAANL